MTDTAFVIVRYYDALGIRTRGSYPQEIRIRMSEIPTLVTEIIKDVPRDAPGAALLDQIIAAARARRSRDPTNAERQRRFRQRRALKKPSEAVTSSKVKTASS
jgi:hypothetical protein